MLPCEYSEPSGDRLVVLTHAEEKHLLWEVEFVLPMSAQQRALGCSTWDHVFAFALCKQSLRELDGTRMLF